MNTTSEPMSWVTSDRNKVLDKLSLHKDFHTYAIIRVHEFWNSSIWWINGDNVIGLMSLPYQSVPALYTITPSDTHKTGDMLKTLIKANMVPDHCYVLTHEEGAQHLTENGWSVNAKSSMNIMTGTLGDMDFSDIVIADSKVKDGLAVLNIAEAGGINRLLSSDDRVGGYWGIPMLKSGTYIGMFDNYQLVAVAGTHDLNYENSLATLGNVIVDKNLRGKGYGKQVTLGVLANLYKKGFNKVSLGVREGNFVAYNLYEQLGFKYCGSYIPGTWVK